ncbi:MAG: proton-conducting transporter membrane subunit, partial [Novosphingobium sp.]
HEQDMRFYGNLRKQIPITFWAMTFGTLAITGVGLFGVGFAGYHSKDSIIEAAYASGTGMGQFAYWMGIVAALMTSFYSWRLVFLTFFGKPRWAGSEHIQHAVHDAHGHGHAHDDHGHGHADHDDGTAGYHPHESPLVMLIPLVLLSVGAIAAGYVFEHAFVSDGMGEFWKGSLVFHEHLIHAMHGISGVIKYMPFIVMLIGLVIAWYGYIKNTRFPAAVAEQLGPVYTFVYRKWMFDELYHYMFVVPAFWIGKVFWKVLDIGVIDRFGPDGAAWAVAKGSTYAQKVQSGYLYSYALIMLLGLVGAISWVIAG